ncbi:MAG: cyclase family protein [Tissierellia bacterium]|jgi:arylformamidase|nr:cyclase family protein [Tissierellia bacterium]
MKIIDLSHALEVGMTQFPGTPPIEVKQICHYDPDGFRLTDLHSSVHTGTHCDAPGHYIEGGKMIDELGLDKFVGEAVIIDVDTSEGRELPVSILDGKDIRKDDIVILRTNMSKYWNMEEYITDYPYLSIELAERLVELEIKALGMDCLSPDSVDSDKVHKVILGAEIIAIENLNNLDQIHVDRFNFYAAPLLISNSEGGFTRAFAIL